MRRWFYLPVIILLYCIFTAGCGTGVVNPTSPGEASIASRTVHAGQVALVGLWQVAVDESSGAVVILPSRSANWSLNALNMLQTSTPIGLEIDPNSVQLMLSEHRVSLVVRLRHPLQPLAGLFTAFDVRGIVFGPIVENADCFTAHLNPNDFSWVPFGYIDGDLGTPDWLADFHAPYSGYKYFCDGLGADDELVDFMRSPTGCSTRGRFAEGSQNRRRYVLDWDDSNHGFLIFNYAVLASYGWPIPASSAPFGLDDFSVSSANCAEAFCIEGQVTDNTAYYWSCIGGGQFSLDLEVWDWQGLQDTELTLRPMSGNPFQTQTTANYAPGATPYSGIFSFGDVAVVPLSNDDIRLVVTATDHSNTFGGSWFGNLLPHANWRYDDYVYTVNEMNLPVNYEPPCLPALLDESFDGDPLGWEYGPGSFWNFNYCTPSAADNRSDSLCYGNPTGHTITWCASPVMYVKPGCYNLPLKLRMRHMIDVESYYDRCWVEIKINCDDWKKIHPYCFWNYNSNGWWDGIHQEDCSMFILPDLEEGDQFRIRFITHTLDGNSNCMQDGYNGWQIFKVIVADYL